MSLDEIPEPTDEELAEMEAALDEVYGDSAYDQGDEYDIDWEAFDRWLNGEDEDSDANP